MSRNKIYLSLLLLLWVSSSYGQATVDQRVVPPSPNSSALIRLANTSVHEFSGTAAVNIPLASLPAKTINVPITLNYRAGGIKVQEIATSVGLGWNLSAGGRITRVVKGIPDYEDSECASNPLVTSSMTIDQAASGNCDPEWDIYYFNFFGRTGKFYVNAANDQVVPVPMTDMEYEYSHSQEEFIITDEQGYSFHFGLNNQNIEFTTLSTSNELVSSSSTGYRVGPQRSSDPSRWEFEYTYNSAWLLYKVVSPQSREIADFTYEASDIEVIYYHEKVIEAEGSTVSDQYQIDTKVEINQKYISEINTDFGSVLFTYSSGRKDLFGGKRLESLKVRDDSNSEISHVQLGYDYVDKFKTYAFPGAAVVDCSSDYDCNRLLLKTITSNNILLNSFEYIDENTFTFPRRYDPFMDHWGFFNYSSAYGLDHNGNKSAIPDVSSVVPTAGLVAGSLTGARKTAHQTGWSLTLYKIYNSGGGYQRFEFEEHSSDVGGPRLKNTWLSADGINEWKEDSYSYASPYDLGTPVYHYQPQLVNDLVIKSSAYNELNDLNGLAISYGSVSKTLADGSKMVNYYSNSERSDVNPVNSVVLLNGFNFSSSSLSQQGSNGPPFTSKTSKFWERGILKESQLIDATGSLVKKIVNTPNYSYSEISNIPNWTMQTIYDNWNSQVADPDRFFYIGQYNIISKYINASETIVYDYDQDNDTKKLSERTEYTYHPTKPSLVQSMIQYHADGSETKTTYKYPFDYAPLFPVTSDTRVEALATLKQNNAIAVPIEIIQYFRKDSGVAFKVVGAELNTYQLYRHNSLDKPLLYKTYELRLSQSVSSITESYVDGSTIFRYDSRYKLINTYTFDPATENLLNVAGESGLEQDYSYNSSDYLISATLNPGGNSQTTTYTHKKLVGITSVTDPNNNDQDFEYDSKNRLKLIRDRDGNIVKRYRYNYRDIGEHNADFTWSGTARVGNQLTFTVLSEPASIGQTKYYWDFGEGTVVETTSTSTNHTYSSSGSQTVTLVAVNPEFGSATTSLPITISPPPPISASPSSLSFAYTSGSKNVSLSNVIGTPTVTDNRSWISVSNVSSSSITVNCTSNSGSENSRTGTVTVSDSNSTKYITVIQAPDPTQSICPPGCRWVAATSQCISNTTGLECPQ
ncbi:MAG: PKD domain-containing protein [Bacteroidota bacterium]